MSRAQTIGSGQTNHVWAVSDISYQTKAQGLRYSDHTTQFTASSRITLLHYSCLLPCKKDNNEGTDEPREERPLKKYIKDY